LRPWALRPQLKRDPLGSHETMLLMRVLRSVVLLAVLIAAPGRSVAGQKDSLAAGAILHFGSDSVEFINAGPMYLATGEPGFLLAFHPFVPIEDTIKLRALAGAIWGWLRPQLDTSPRSFIVLQATSQRAHPAFGIQGGHGRNLVLEKRADGKWYFLKETKPAS